MKHLAVNRDHSHFRRVSRPITRRVFGIAWRRVTGKDGTVHQLMTESFDLYTTVIGLPADMFPSISNEFWQEQRGEACCPYDRHWEIDPVASTVDIWIYVWLSTRANFSRSIVVFWALHLASQIMHWLLLTSLTTTQASLTSFFGKAFPRPCNLPQ